MIFKEDKGTGYMYCYSPQHPLANKAGKVYEHHYVMSSFIKRKLYSNECVHHIDRDRKNNKIENLMLLTKSEHLALHALEDLGSVPVVKNCLTCNSPFTVSSNSSQEYCSKSCVPGKRKFHIDREDLYMYVWTMPTQQVAKILGVSDVAVAKRCKKLNIPKPPRGYWAKVAAGIKINIPPLPL